MRMSTDESRDEDLALRTIAAAAGAGITVFDTARAYGPGEAELGHNERLLARALRRSSSDTSARIVTKGGITRAGGSWIPDGRAKAILADCDASLGALDGLPIDLYLIHAPDPRTPWRTSVRALARLVDEGVVRRVGLANVNRRQLDEALELAPITAVQVALSPYRRHRLPRRSRRALCRVRDRRHRPLAARRSTPGGSTRPAPDACRGRGVRAARPRLRWRSPGCWSSRPSWLSFPARVARRPRARPRGRRRSSSTPTTKQPSPRPSAHKSRIVVGRRARRRTRTSSSSWASPARERAVSRRTTSLAATAGSTGTSVEGPCERSPARSTRSCPRARAESSSTTRISPARREAM